MSDWLIRGNLGSSPTDLSLMTMGLLLAFLCGQTLAWVYMYTHSGLSYSKSFVNSLVVIPILVAMVMSVLSNNLVNAFGLMAVFAIVRFRNILRDTLDTSYILSVIVVGMACGTYKYTTALAGCLLASALLVYLHLTSFGSRQRYDMILNLRWDRPLKEAADLLWLLNRHSLSAICVSQRSHEGAADTDFSYRLLLRNPARMEDLLSELRGLNGVSRVTGLKAEQESEV